MKRTALMLCSTVAFGLLLFACQKQLKFDKQKIISSEEIKKTNDIVKVSQLYFKDTVLKSEISKSTNVKSEKRVKNDLNTKINVKPNRIEKIEDLINWEEGFPVKINDKQLVFVPLKENIKPFTDKSYEFTRFLIFKTNVYGYSSMSIIEILSDKATSLGDAKAKAIDAFRNVYLGQSNSIPFTNASVILYDQKYERLQSFHITNGAWERKRIDFRSDLDIKQ